MKVIIYTTPTCEWSTKAMEWLADKGVEFEERDLTEEDSYRDEILEKSSQIITPTFDIAGKIIVGFNSEELTKAIQTQA